MPFGRKNARATYQRAMVALFHDMMHKEIEVYVDDMIAKSKSEEEHLVNLRRLFERLQKFKLRLNPAKCTFGVKSGKLLGFIISQKGIEVDPDKVRAIIEMPIPNTEKEPDFPDEDIMALFEENEGRQDEKAWIWLFDGASNALGHGIGAMLISPESQYIPMTARLCFNCTNNIAEYEACAMGIRAAIESKAKFLKVYGDSALVIHQLKGEWETRDQKLIPYQAYIKGLIEYFDFITFQLIPREDNQLADALATLSSMFELVLDRELPMIKMESCEDLVYCHFIEEESDGKPWYFDIKHYLETREYPERATDNDKRALRRLAASFILNRDVLYKRNHDMVLLICVDAIEAEVILKDVHEGTFGTHMNGHSMVRKILRAGYFWLTMENDCCRHVRKCEKCQVYADNINTAPTTLNVLTSPWPFSMWGIYVFGAIEPKASNGHRFILVAIDYYTKWVEAASYASVTRKVVPNS
ncbi:uncharacterized protein LOC114184644 [Vigna unguiculata]|uniref:uncharacterized protein LOC114184644 n=1 Tax=Vigna unguiculata TaxID=3917 RepID=UPI0010164A66|nr:uncharacterized protein LOC114184644 [Vigna unguiculata]